MSLKKPNISSGVRLVPDDVALEGLEGELKVSSTTPRVKTYVEGATRDIVTADQTQVLTNKTIDADNNTISDLELDNLKAGVLNTSTSLSGAADTQVPSALAVKTYVDNGLAGQNEASEISFAPAGTIAATTVQAMGQELDGDIQAHLSDATDAHDASAISVVPTGNLAADDVQEALVELQTDVDTRATSSALTAHTTASTNVHGLAVGSSVVGTTDSQALTNKTITGADIRTPVRSDVKQDTKANLTTYAITASNGQLAFATDTKEMFQVVDGLLESVGGGEGIGGVDILFTQTFETASLSDFTQTGLSLSTSAPLHGEVSALLTHQPATSQSFKQVIAVDRKFRTQSMVMRLNVKSNASAGNVVLNVYDETNAANLVASEQLQLSNDVNGELNSVGFTIPETCASLSYTITALQEAGSPVTRVDDVIAELAVTALLETSVEVPVVETQTSRISQSASFGNADITGAVTSSTGSGVYSYNSGTGVYTVIKNAQFDISATFRANGAASVQPLICDSSGSVEYATDTSLASVAARANASGSFYLAAGSTFKIRNALAGTTNEQYISVNAVYTSSTTKVIPLTQSGLIQNIDTTIRLDTANGYGSTATKVRRFTNIRTSIGSDVIYADSAVTGSSFTAVTSGVYEVSYSENMASGAWLGLSLNASSLTTNIESLSSSERLASTRTATSGGTCAWQGYLNAGDIIRPMTDGTAAGNNALVHFTIAKQSSLRQVTVNPNSKITIPSSELRMEGASSRGATSTAIVRFDNIANVRGDAFTIVSDSNVGTVITMKKAGKLDIQATLVLNGAVAITLNQAILTAFPTAASETVSTDSANASGIAANPAASISVKVGDILRVSGNNNPQSNSVNNLSLFFQEQDIQVSVSNTLPQFSDSDSSVRVDTANGYGSTATKIRRFSNVRENIGVDVEYADSATNGASFTAKSNGIYNITYTDEFSAVSSLGISKNASSLTANIEALPRSEVLATSSSAGANFAETSSWQGYLLAGDVIRAQAQGTSVGVNGRVSFTMSKVGKPNVTGVDVTPFVNIPLPNTTPWQAVTLTSTWTNLTLTGAARRNGDSMDLRVYGVLTGTPSGGGLYIDMPTFNGAAIVVDTAKIPGAAANYVYVSSGYLRDAGTANYTPVMAVYDSTTRFGFSYGTALNAVNPTSPFTFASTDFFNISIQGIPVVGWDVVPNQIVSAPETFSTDTASLTYAGSAQYTLSTLANAPVGTFITFTYASSSNTRTQTNAAAPSQTTSSMAINGIQLFARAYNAASTSGNPASIAMQIGKGLKGLLTSGYSATAKSGAIALDMFIPSTTVQRGTVVTYEESTGILQVDCAAAEVSSNTARSVGQDATGQAVSNGYIVINASKNPALTGINSSVCAGRVVSSSGQTITNGTPTKITWNSPTFVQNITWDSTNSRFVAQVAGTYQIDSSITQTRSWTAGQQTGVRIYKNGSLYSGGAFGVAWAAFNGEFGQSVSDVVNLAAGDYVEIYGFMVSGAGNSTLIANASFNYFSISKVGGLG